MVDTPRDQLDDPLAKNDIMYMIYAMLGKFPDDLLHRSRNLDTYFHANGESL